MTVAFLFLLFVCLFFQRGSCGIAFSLSHLVFQTFSEQEQDALIERMRKEREQRKKKEEEEALTLEQTKEQVIIRDSSRL